MPEAITIKERIEREIKLRVEGIAELTGKVVERWDALDNSRAHLSVLIVSSDEVAEPEAMGNPGTDRHTFNIDVEICIAQPDSGAAENGSFVHNRWLGLLEAAIIPPAQTLLEAVTLKPIAVEVRVTGSDLSPVTEEQPEAYTTLSIEVTYDTNRGNPYVGPAVTQQEV